MASRNDLQRLRLRRYGVDFRRGGRPTPIILDSLLYVPSIVDGEGEGPSLLEGEGAIFHIEQINMRFTEEDTTIIFHDAPLAGKSLDQVPYGEIETLIGLLDRDTLSPSGKAQIEVRIIQLQSHPSCTKENAILVWKAINKFNGRII